MIKWIKNKLGITELENENKRLKQQLKWHKSFVVDMIAELKEYTRVYADIGFRGNNTIILTGVYRNQGYVRFYDVGDGEFMAMVERMKEMKGYGIIRNIDSPPSFRGSFEI